MLFAEPASQYTENATELTVDARFGEAFHVKTRRFVVIRADTSSCSAMLVAHNIASHVYP